MWPVPAKADVSMEADAAVTADTAARSSAPSAGGRREFTAALLAGATGAALILLALRQVWAHAVYAPPHPFPAQDIAVSGQKLIPLASGLAIAALACLAAIIATRGLARRAVGGLLTLIGIAAVVTATAAVTSGAVIAAATSTDPSAGAFSYTVTGGANSGGTAWSTLSAVGVASGHAVITGLPWHAAAVIGALVVVLAGLATIWRGTAWPVMSARYEQPAERAARLAEQDSATMWESLSRDVDPTVTDDVDFGSDPRRPRR